MELTNENYYSRESDQEYMSCSQFKLFDECPAKAMAVLNGTYKIEETDSMLVGSYVDAWLDGELDKFMEEHPQIFNSRTGELKKDFKQAEELCQQIERDEYLYDQLKGQRQQIITGSIASVKFKGKIDSLLDDYIVDGKVLKDCEDIWKNGEKLPFYKANGYDLQGAIYKTLYQQMTGKDLPFRLAVITKEKTPDKIYDIVKSLKDNYDIPITVKIRAGWDASSINCDQVTKLATKAGVDAIAIHGRTRAQMYNGNANLEYIKMVRDSTDKVVIGNGDIKDYASAKRMLEETNVDALMIGRASLGNPWVFEEIEKGFKNELIVKPTKEVIIDTLLEHAKVLMASKGEHIAMIEMRTHAGWYLKQIPGTKQYRPLIVSIKTMQELEKICQDVLNNPYLN